MFFRLLLLPLLLLCLSASAQDTIFYRDGTLRYVKVIEIGEEYVKYKNQNNADGPDYVIRKKEVNRIGYKNGTSETFGSAGGTKMMPVPAVEARSNYLSINAIDLMAGLVTVSYERSFKDPRFAVELAVSSGMESWRFSGRKPSGNNMKYYSSTKPIGVTATGFFYNKAQQQNVNFSVGTELGAGLFYYNAYRYSPYYFPYNYQIKGAPYYTFAFAFGCKVIPADMLFVNFSMALGSQFKKGVESNYYSYWSRGFSPYARLGVNVGYRF